ncbi:hypothetical protein Glove_283g53 [Diversispora epigaea]|uniref:Serine-threonine/tyrosine-protein kinase catalytic domain-containing protein n=1 Tax=Diversispora epigaea TaxID=1348612 RepID=A0A397I5C4_9GLOM|nr:hypothetical protein Glove_283g53 [Diversispora epigaea]
MTMQICNGLRPEIPIYTPKLITTIMRCWDTQVTNRPTLGELYQELWKYYCDYKENDFKNHNEITIQIENATSLDVCAHKGKNKHGNEKYKDVLGIHCVGISVFVDG